MTGDPASSLPAERTLVLVVDDEPALMAARRVAVVVCDHMLPGEAGLDFLVRMRERYPETRRILLTGYINPELFSRSYVVGELSACLLKPVNHAELAVAVRAAAQR